MQDKERHSGRGDLQGYVQEIKISPYFQMVYVQTGIHPGK